MSSWTDEDRARISDELTLLIPPELVISKENEGQKMYLLQIEPAYALADEIFGAGNWHVQQRWQSINYESKTNTNGETIPMESTDKCIYEVCISCCCRVTLLNGVCHEDVGNGVARDTSYLKARKQAEKFANSEAIKRCLRKFGNALGNCLYDKQYISYLDSIL